MSENTGPILTQGEKKRLRSLSHHRRALVSIGQAGLHESLIKAIDEALEVHELMKVKITGCDRTQRQEMIDAILDQTHAALVQRVGFVVTLYRRRVKDPKIDLTSA